MGLNKPYAQLIQEEIIRPPGVGLKRGILSRTAQTITSSSLQSTREPPSRATPRDRASSRILAVGSQQSHCATMTFATFGKSSGVLRSYQGAFLSVLHPRSCSPVPISLSRFFYHSLSILSHLFSSTYGHLYILNRYKYYALRSVFPQSDNQLRYTPDFSALSL